MRVGMGYDVHKLTENSDLILGGVKIPWEKGLLGHSDADVLIHAVMDALLGAAALGDIGKHFPDTDPKYKGISSVKLLIHVSELLKEHGYEVGNIDATIIAQAASEGCRLLSANALYLIHTAICSTEGNAAEIAGKIDLLHQTDARIAAVYASRSGRPAAEFEALMAENNGNGRWLAPEEAVAAGLADKVVEAAEQPASSLARNIARGWERLLANIGLWPGPALPADRNVLHFDGEVQALRSRSAVAADEARRQAAPTSTQPREDPSCGDTVRSANERAYAEDARRMRN